MRSAKDVKYAKDRSFKQKLYHVWKIHGMSGALHRMTIYGTPAKAISRNEACKMLGISPRWFRALVQKGVIPEDVFATVRWKFYTPHQVKLIAAYLDKVHKYSHYRGSALDRVIVRARTVMHRDWSKGIVQHGNAQEKPAAYQPICIVSIRNQARQTDRAINAARWRARAHGGAAGICDLPSQSKVQ